MAVGFIDIDIVGSKRDVQTMLEHLDSALSDIGMRIFMSGRVAPFLRERAKDRFKGEGDDASGRWKALSTATHSWRENYGFPPAHPINRRTGALEEYIVDAPSKVITAKGFAQLVWPDAPPSNPITAKKLRVAQRGIDHPQTVSRPVLALGEMDLAFVLTQLALHIQGWEASIQ